MKRYPRHTAKGRGNRFIVPLSGGYTDSTTVSGFVADALPGEIAVINPETKAVLTAALAEGDKFQFIHKLNDKDEVAYSDTYIFKPNYLCSSDVIAGDNQVQTVTITSAATAKRQVFELAIMDETYPGRINKPHLFEFVSVTGAETAAQVAQGIMDNYNFIKDMIDLPFVMAISGAVLTITTKEEETRLVATVSQDATATIAITTPYVVASGTGESTYMEELAGAGYDGLSNWKAHEYSDEGNMTPFSKKGCTYDEISINNPQTVPVLGHVPSMTIQTESPTLVRIETTAVGTSGSPAYTAMKTIFGL